MDTKTMSLLTANPDTRESTPDLLGSPGPDLLTEVEGLHKLLLQQAKENSPDDMRSQDDPFGKRMVWIWWGTVACLLLLKVPLGSVWIALVALGLTVICVWMGARSLSREWRHRQVDTLQRLQASFDRERPFIEALLPYSRAALLHVAASARAPDGRVWSRISFFLGPNRAGGLLGALFLILGIFSAGKYLQDQEVILPLLGTKITVNHILMVGGGLLTGALALLFAGASVNGLNGVADLLERVAALKKHHTEDRKAGKGR